MIPREDSRLSGNVGGGVSKPSSRPFFCKKCGKTTTRKQVMDSVDVCKKCRLKK